MAKPKYDENFPLLAEDYARRGMIDKEIAKKLGIGERTFYEYQDKYPQFSQAIKRGKAPVDVEVENALLKRARGFEYEEIHTEYRLKAGKTKVEDKAKPSVVKRIKKTIVPDVTACIIWLKNRRPDLWRDKQEYELTGDLTVKQQFEDRLDEYFEEQGRDGIVNFFKELGTVVVPGNKRTNH